VVKNAVNPFSLTPYGTHLLGVVEAVGAIRSKNFCLFTTFYDWNFCLLLAVLHVYCKLVSNFFNERKVMAKGLRSV
jgi:hypothetical protein